MLSYIFTLLYDGAKVSLLMVRMLSYFFSYASDKSSVLCLVLFKYNIFVKLGMSTACTRMCEYRFGGCVLCVYE